MPRRSVSGNVVEKGRVLHLQLAVTHSADTMAAVYSKVWLQASLAASKCRYSCMLSRHLYAAPSGQLRPAQQGRAIEIHDLAKPGCTYQTFRNLPGRDGLLQQPPQRDYGRLKGGSVNGLIHPAGVHQSQVIVQGAEAVPRQLLWWRHLRAALLLSDGYHDLQQPSTQKWGKGIKLGHADNSDHVTQVEHAAKPQAALP